MTKQIAVILPGTLLPATTKNLADDILVFEAALDKAAELAKDLEKQNIEVIISRGGTAQAIKEAVAIPVVSAEATSFDVLDTLWNTKNRYPELKRLGLINFGKTRYDAETMSKILNLSIEQYAYFKPDDLAPTIRKAQKKGISVVVGGNLTVKYAREMGINGVLQQLGKETIIKAINEAREIAAIRMQDEVKTERLRAILNFIHEGVIAVDDTGVVTLFNQAAEKILNIKSDQVIGRLLNEAFPSLNWNEVLVENSYSLDQLVSVNNTQIVANRIPIRVGKKVTGAVSTFRQVDNILKAEQKIRKELHTRGLISHFNFDDVIGQSPSMQKIIKTAHLYAQTDSTILITGETGTGKEIIAGSIHHSSSRKEGPFVAVNCAALPEQLLESELFGYEEGAFTGAKRGGKQGLFELAHNGTIFLDEIGDMPVSLQARLLRVIQRKEVMRVGGEKVVPVNVRIIAATNQNLREAIKQGKFREDLYFRINVLNLMIPPLRERKEDISLLLNYFVRKYCRRYNLKPKKIPEDVVKKISAYQWPGNVRELENFTERFVILCSNVLSTEELVNHLIFPTPGQENTAVITSKDGGKLTVNVEVGPIRQMEDNIIEEVYKLTGKNKYKTALLLGISRTTVWKKIKEIY